MKQNFKLFAPAIFVILMAGFTATVCAQKGDPYSVDLVKNLLQSPVSIGAGFSEKQLNRLGDKASIALLKILNERDFQDTGRVRNCLLIIRGAFGAPNLIGTSEDKKPGVTLFLLTHLERDIGDATVRREVSETISFVKMKTGSN